MPLHPWCFDIFCRQSQIHSKEVDASGLMNWRNSELDSREFYQFPRTEDVKIARGQWWSHDLGSEYLVANPLYVPGLSELLLSAVNGEIKSEQHAQCEKVQLSQFTKTQPTSSQHQPVDFFSSIPLEIRLMIVGYLGSDDITSLRAASRTFTTLPNNVWYRLIREEMPWLWEAWDESECKHTPQIWTTVSTAQVKSILKSRERLSEVLRLEYMTHEDSEKVAENWFPIPCDIPEQVHLPRLATDWHFVFVQINKDWNRLKGLRNRQRIWIDVEEIMRRIQNLK
jgi:hypothetical protein